MILTVRQSKSNRNLTRSLEVLLIPMSAVGLTRNREMAHFYEARKVPTVFDKHHGVCLWFKKLSIAT